MTLFPFSTNRFPLTQALRRATTWGLLVGLLGSGCAANISLKTAKNNNPAIPAFEIPTGESAVALCGNLPTPLTDEEQVYAQVAWQYFVNNRQPKTGMVNAADSYPSGTLWDQGNYLTALNAVLWMDLIDKDDFDQQFTQFLSGLAQLPLFEDTLPHKVYNSATAEIVDYGNNPSERGLGWSALDIGRMLAALHVMRTCHPQYAEMIESVVATWDLEASIKDGQLYGATVTDKDKTQRVQEGRLGYEEYAARGYERWGYSVPKALALEPKSMVSLEGVSIPVDTRDFATTNANNYVVSESYILDAIEFGLSEELEGYAKNLLMAQKKRFERTGKLTAVSEDNLDQAPHFLYNTAYSNGEDWAVITDKNEAFPELRTLSTKAAFGWRYLFPDDAYAKQVFDVAKTLQDPDKKGFYAGQYESNKKPNAILTGNTNGLILEILYYKARGNQHVLKDQS
ncbi:MAG: DUF3131 domain-containing protein [Cyanobacteria bacterium P01_F01_bin.53]